jgi:tetratricopeptide (TPR) repeat protein
MKRFMNAVGFAALAAAVACAPASPPATPAPTPTGPAAPSIMQTCPGPTDGPSIIVNAIEEANRALATNPATPLPPACVIGAYTQLTTLLPDSIDVHALAIATELSRRGGNQKELLAGEVVLFARAKRYAEASSAFERLTAIDRQPSLQVMHLAIIAARERSDTASLIRLLTRASSAPDAMPAYRAELNVVRQAGALRSAIDEARGLVRQNPKYVAAYPSLIGNFGTLGLADSMVAYARRALAQGAPRASLVAAVDPFVNATLRHAALYGSSYGWEKPVAAAMRVDSVLASPSTKFLVASLIVQAAEPDIAEIGALVSGTSWIARASGADATARNRATGCGRIAGVSASLNVAESKLRDGGDRYAGGGVAQITSGLKAERGRLGDLQAVCAR